MPRFLTWAVVVMLMPFTKRHRIEVNKFVREGTKGTVWLLWVLSVRGNHWEIQGETSALGYSSLEFRRLFWCRDSHLGALNKLMVTEIMTCKTVLRERMWGKQMVYYRMLKMFKSRYKSSLLERLRRISQSVSLMWRIPCWKFSGAMPKYVSYIQTMPSDTFQH